MCEFVLASASPRRRQLLFKHGLKFSVRPAASEVGMPCGIPLYLAVIEVAALKAVEAAKGGARDEIIISADTVVALSGRVLGKPKGEGEAREMLAALSGREHRVLTGFCCLRMRDGKMAAAYEETKVFFKELSAEQIDSYIKTKEPMDKAGAYGIQGGGGDFVKEISGDFENVVGLPVKRLFEMLYDEFDYRRDKGV